MTTVYPDEKEINFRKSNGGIETILNSTVECAICQCNILNEIILKKLITVHANYLILCCHIKIEALIRSHIESHLNSQQKCFYKLFESIEFNCILCKSNKQLSNCVECNLNVCKRCIGNHKINSVSDGILKKCVNCVPRILWKQRAKAIHVLTIFSSQLDMPNGLLVNETERDQTVLKYLIKESKIGQNSITNNLKDQMCINFMLNSFKSTVLDKLSEFSPDMDGTSSTNKCLNKSIDICENILENTCSTLNNFKRIFNLNSFLSPSVTAIIKTLFKSVDEDDSVLSKPILNSSLEELMKNNLVEESSKKLNDGKRKISEKNHSKDANLKSIVLNKTNIIKANIKECWVVLEPLDESILSKYNVKQNNLGDSALKISLSNSSDEVSSDKFNDEMAHPLELFGDSCSEEEEKPKSLRNRSVKTNKKEKQRCLRSTKNMTILDDKSDDEKEIDRLIQIDSILNSSKKKIEDDSDTDSDNDSTINVNKNSKAKIFSKKKTLELMNETIQSLDKAYSGTDNSENEEYSLNSIKDVFNENRFDSIPPIDTMTDDESDDSTIIEVVQSCLLACQDRKVDNTKNSKDNKIDSSKITSDMSVDLENDKLENSDDPSEGPGLQSKPQNPLLKMLSSVISDSDSNSDKGTKSKGKKRKIESSSDSSSKYFKKDSKRKKKRVFKTNVIDSTNSDSSDSSSSVIKTFKRKKKSNSISSDESSDNSEDNTPKKKGRKNIRKLKKKKDLSQLTKNALIEEDSRIKRMEERQNLYNQMYELPKHNASCEKLVLDFDPKTKKELVVVHPDLVKLLKPHQAEGVQFMWNAVFESLARIKEHAGNGSILAHCMGLGKTLQVITLIHTLFQYPEIGVKTVLIIAPYATIENWYNEFDKWLKNIDDDKKILIYSLIDSKSFKSRKSVIAEWQKNHGVLIISYQLYQCVVNKSKRTPVAVLEGLVNPGPDLVICDEGHIIKNQASATAKTINRIKTLRRILLTGTPLQNNLKEYHCMVDFIRPNLLGSLKEFTNRFINPITNGQYSDSTTHDVRVMKRRSHVLHRMLEGFVQRRDYGVLTPFLPPKHEYVIYLKMSEKQIELYKHFLSNHRQTDLFTNYNVLQMIWTHPKLLKLYSKRTDKRRELEKLKAIESSFLRDTSSDNISSEDVEIVEASDLTKTLEMDHNWWKPLLSNKDLERVHPYSKFLMMFSILKECEEIGDKVLIFSQSLFTLDLIQDMLNNAEDLEDEGGPYGNSWNEGIDYFKIDGSVSVKVREECCNQFNDLKNTKLRLLLLSTKAFNLGINLIGANRVIIFDVTWNPSLNVQSIFRIFRFGQKKPCYVYRFISEGTMEQKIYERQISKLSLAFRVVDEHQIDRHFNAKDQEELYEFDPNTTEPKSTLNLPKDRLMAELILKHKDLVMDILEHDSLLQNNEAEELNESDRNAAWDEFQKEKSDLSITPPSMNNQSIRGVHQLNSLIHTLPQNVPGDVVMFNTLHNLFPAATIVQINDMMMQVKTQQRKMMNVEQ